MAKTIIEKIRIPIFQILAVLVISFIAISESAWETESPIISSILFFIGIILAAIASLGRLWCSLYIAGWKTKVLITKGPYSMSRNPLYFFSLIGLIGVGLSSETIFIPCILVIAFAIYYPFVIKDEEKKLKSLHGEQFEEYSKRVPKFIPNAFKLVEPQEYIVNPIIFRGHIFSALWFIWFIGILEIIEELHELGFLPIIFKIY